MQTRGASLLTLELTTPQPQIYFWENQWQWNSIKIAPFFFDILNRAITNEKQAKPLKVQCVCDVAVSYVLL